MKYKAVNFYTKPSTLERKANLARGFGAELWRLLPNCQVLPRHTVHGFEFMRWRASYGGHGVGGFACAGKGGAREIEREATKHKQWARERGGACCLPEVEREMECPNRQTLPCHAVQRIRFRVRGLGLGFGVWGLGFGFGVWVLRSRVRGSGFRA